MATASSTKALTNGVDKTEYAVELFSKGVSREVVKKMLTRKYGRSLANGTLTELKRKHAPAVVRPRPSAPTIQPTRRQEVSIEKMKEDLDNNVTFEVVTPEQAAAWIENSAGNRRTKTAHVRGLAAEMDRGNWQPHLAAIEFLKDGRLCNGHHRMHALILHGKPLIFMIRRNVTEEYRARIDSEQQGRSLPDLLKMLRPEVKNAQRRVAILNACVRRISNQIRLRTLQHYDDWCEIFGPGVEFVVAQSLSNHGFTAQVSGAIAYCYMSAPQEVEVFTEQLVSGQNLKAGSPALALRNGALLKSKRFVSFGSATHGDLFSKTVSAIYAHINQIKLTKIMASGEAVKAMAEYYETPKVEELTFPWLRVVNS